MRVGDSSRCSEEIVKNLELRLSVRLVLIIISADKTRFVPAIKRQEIRAPGQQLVEVGGN